MKSDSHERHNYPQRVVCIGGGTGLPAVLRGLRQLVLDGRVSEVAAIVAMSDDGGSSGRLRRSMGLPPPGDIRNCLVALAEEETLLAGLFQHRYRGDNELEGHSVGNLILAALAEQTGCFLKAVEASSRVLRTAGRILPATQQDVSLVATLRDGRRVVGETQIAALAGGIDRITLSPADPPPAPGVIEAILEADLVIMGPGSLYTSILPNLAVAGVADALMATKATVVLVANLVSERSEAQSLELSDHIAELESHSGERMIDGILLHDGVVPPEILLRYESQGCRLLEWPDRLGGSPIVARRNLLAGGPKLRHDPAATVAGLLDVWERLSITSSAERAS